jgi:L-serine dehydratase
MVSIFELFKIGIGPSSSHTVGPMIGACRFAKAALLARQRQRTDPQIARVVVKLYGSLALTGEGHATDVAILAGLTGLLPDRTDPATIRSRVDEIRQTKRLRLHDEVDILFDESTDLQWLRNETLPQHPNGIQFQLFDSRGAVVFADQYFSTGGGFVYSLEEFRQQSERTSSGGSTAVTATVPFPFISAKELLETCNAKKISIAELIHENEKVHRSENQIAEQLDLIWQVMRSCIEKGCHSEGILPGSLKVRRRAPEIFKKLLPNPIADDSLDFLEAIQTHCCTDPLYQLDWTSLFALAVNEENAAGGRVVTAPTNGAAGVIPAVLAYYLCFCDGANRDGMHRFLKTAGAIGLLYKRNASLSAAEMGCQGEVGVACSMAAGGLAACMNGTVEQIENAAEIGMEHNLGLTCDPIAGLVQVPCIERNTMGAAKAINAARLAVLYGDGKHYVSLDRVIETMRQTGVDMQVKYKETSLGGLAVNVVDC